MAKVKTGVPLLLSGNEAVAYGALAAGARFYAGYPITPSTEIAEVMAEECPGPAESSYRWRTRWPASEQ